jgi:hypothetical protein
VKQFHELKEMMKITMDVLMRLGRNQASGRQGNALNRKDGKGGKNATSLPDLSGLPVQMTGAT